jgi:hypothetical protein
MAEMLADNKNITEWLTGSAHKLKRADVKSYNR